MEKDFDIIIYGATGFTGKLCVKYLSENAGNIKWGIAGRNKKKLQKAAIEIQETLKEDNISAIDSQIDDDWDGM